MAVVSEGARCTRPPETRPSCSGDGSILWGLSKPADHVYLKSGDKVTAHRTKMKSKMHLTGQKSQGYNREN